MGTIRVKLQDWLKNERRSQAWLAQEVGGIHQTTVSLWLHGGRMPLEAAIRISRITGIDVEDLAVLEDVAPEPRAATGT